MSLLNLTPQEINETFPVVGMKVTKGGIEVLRSSSLSLSQIRRQRLRGLIKRLSRRSLSRLAWMVASSKVKFKSLLTLTYGANIPINGKEAKNQFRAFMMVMFRVYGDFSYVWFMEFQRRGAVHFHILTTLDNPQDNDRLIISQAWARIAERENFPYSGLKLWEDKLIRWSSGYTRDAVRKFHQRRKVWENLKYEDGAIRYCIMYATKPHQKTVPEWFVLSGRFWGNSRDVPTSDYIQFSAGDKDVRELAAIVGRNLDNWQVLPKLILINSQNFDKFRTKAYNDINK